MNDKSLQVRHKDRLAEKAADLRVGHPQVFGHLIRNIDVLENIENKAKKNNYFNSDGSTEGKILSALETENIVETWGDSNSNPTYHIDRPQIISEFKETVESYDTYYGWNKSEIRGSLIAVANHLLEEDERLSRRKFDEIDYGTPSTYTVRNEFDSWNQALLRSGLTLRNVKMAEEDVRDRFRKKFYEVSGVPRCDEDFYKDPNMPTRAQTHQDHFGFDSYPELAISEFPHRIEYRNNYRNPVDLLETGERQ